MKFSPPSRSVPATLAAVATLATLGLGAPAHAAPISWDFTASFTSCGGRVGPKSCQQLIGNGGDGIWSVSGRVTFDDGVPAWQSAPTYNQYSFAGLGQFRLEATIEGSAHVASSGAVGGPGFTAFFTNPGSALITVQDSAIGDALTVYDTSSTIDFLLPAGWAPHTFPGRPATAGFRFGIGSLPLATFGSKDLPATPPSLAGLGVSNYIEMQFAYANPQFATPANVFWTGRLDSLTRASVAEPPAGVPEPASLALVGLGLGLLGWRGRRGGLR